MKLFGAFLICLLVSSFALAQTEPTCAPGTRLFDHEWMANGPLCIPEHPQQILALETASAEVTFYAGKTLVAAAPWVTDELPINLPKLAETFAHIEDIGYPASLEKTLAVRPDLILTGSGSDYIDVAAASEIAPVIVAKSDSAYTWKDALELWSAALGTPELYDELTRSYDERILELQEALGPDRKDTEVSVISVTPDFIWMWLVETAPGRILKDVGLARPASQTLTGKAATDAYADAPYVDISEERLDLVDGDEIFAFTYADSSPEVRAAQQTAFDDLARDPIWKTLRAVQDDNVHIVGGYWWRADSYLLANRVIDDLFTTLVGEPGRIPTLTSDDVAR